MNPVGYHRIMDGWSQVSDDDVIVKDNLRLKFAFARGEYTIILEAGARYSLKVEHNGETEVWPISVQEVRGSDIRLSGLADWVPEILENACWFVLEIGSKPQITYWEDKVINRVDFLKP